MRDDREPLPQPGDLVCVDFGIKSIPFDVVEPGTVERNGQYGVHVRALRGGRPRWEVLEKVTAIRRASERPAE